MVAHLGHRLALVSRLQKYASRFPDERPEPTHTIQLGVTTSATLPGDGQFLLLAAFEVAASSGESAEKELLDQIGANPFGGTDREVSEDQPDTTIGSGIVKVSEG
jgi:hypothetical protein